MIRKITLLMIIALAIYSFTYFGSNSDIPKSTNRSTVLFNAYDGITPSNVGKTTNQNFVNIPIHYEGAKSLGDAGP